MFAPNKFDFSQLKTLRSLTINAQDYIEISKINLESYYGNKFSMKLIINDEE